MLLGTAIARLLDEVEIEETLAALGDWVLMARMHTAAAATGQSLTEFVSEAVGAFLGHASDEDWLALMTAADGANNPAAACLKVMMERSLAHQA
jgi:peptidyl-prolyl cis-trans isomerase C